MKVIKILTTSMLSVMMVFTMMPLGGSHVWAGETAGAEVPGGVVTVDITADAKATAKSAFELSDSDLAVAGNTLTISLNKDIVPQTPIRFVKGTAGKKVVLNLNGHTITGKAGTTSDELESAVGGNAIEIAADDFDVEIKGPGSVIGGKGGKLNRSSYSGYRVGVHGGSAVFFCERVDKVHGVTEQWGDIIDEGYHPDKLDRGLTVTGGANLVGGAGADVTLEDWKYNLSKGDEDLFSIVAGRGGHAIDQIFTDSYTENILEELSYAKIVVENGNITGGAGGNVNLGDQLLTTTDIQKIPEIQQFMQGKSAGYDFDSNVKDKISFKPADGGNGIEFFAGRKYIDIENNGHVSGGAGGKFFCSEKASMVKTISTQCGDGGIGIYVCGDTGLTNAKPALTADSWAEKNKSSDDVGIYVAGTVSGGASQSTTLRSDSCGAGGEAIDHDLEGSKLCKPYTVEYGNRPTFDADRGIVLVANEGKVTGGAAGATDEMNISGGSGADAINGGATGGPTASEKMSAAYFIINGESCGGYGSSEGGSGFRMKAESEDVSTGDSTYFCGVIYGNGKIQGGDSGEWPHIGLGYTIDSDRVITSHGSIGDRVIRGEGLSLLYGSDEEATTIGSDLRISDGEPARLMTTSGTFSVTPSMTPFPKGTAPTANTKLSCEVTTPDGYTGKAYIMWSADYENSSPKIIRSIEGANGAYNNFAIPSNDDYPYGWKKVSYGYEYHINVATREHIAERVTKYNDGTECHINCHVLLEDGRFIDNDDIWFSQQRRSPKGWGGSSGGGESDEQAVANVENMIRVLPWPEAITLDYEEEIVAARAAYDALTPAQKAMFDPDILADLMAAEAKIKQLHQNDIQAAEDAASEINQLLESIDGLLDEAGFDTIGDVPDDPANADLLDQIRQKINEASDTYNGLTADQKKLIDQLDQDSDALDNLLSVISDYKEAFPNDDSIVEPKMASLIENCTITTPAVTYTGGDLTPAVTVRDGNKTLTKDKDYTVKYTNNRNVGPGKVTIRGKGDYTGEATGTFRINPKGTTLYKPKRAKKAFTAKWKKQTAKMSTSRITGYQVQYSLKKNFKSKTRTVTVKGYSKSYKKIKKLKKKKTYYVRIRTYKTVGKVNYYSPWSKVKKVKTK